MKREWLINLRNEKELTQETLAEMCNTTQMTISNIENGTRRPSTKLAQRLANILDFKWTRFYENDSAQSENGG